MLPFVSYPRPIKNLFFCLCVFVTTFLMLFLAIVTGSESENHQLYQGLKVTPLNTVFSASEPSLHYYSVDEQMLYDDVLNLSCRGHLLKRTAYVYYSDRESGKIFEVPVSDKMDNLPYQSKNQHLNEYHFGPFELSYPLLRQYFPKKVYHENLVFDPNLQGNWKALASGYEFFLGENPEQPKGDDIKLEYSCQSFSPTILLLSAKSPQGVKLQDIRATFRPNHSLVEQLEVKEKTENYKILGAFFWQAFVLLSFFMYFIFRASSDLVLKIYPLAQSPLLLLALLTGALFVSEVTMIELVYLCCMSLFLMMRYLVQKRFKFLSRNAQ